MVWVRSEYAGELAVLSTWVAALLPWNVHYSSIPGVGSILFLRFPLFQVRYAFGSSLLRGSQLGLPLPSLPPLLDSSGFLVSAMGFQDNADLSTAYWVWAVGAVVYLVALAVSIRYYRDEERVEAWSVDPVTVLGGLLLAAAVLFGVASYFTWGETGLPGTPIPVGTLLVGLLGAVLLSADRT